MTLAFTSDRNEGAPAAPGTHVLIIGVGAYPALLGGSAKEGLADHLGMGQLSSPPASARALADWFLGATGTPNGGGFHNPVAPLSSLEMLISPGGEYKRPDGASVMIEEATRSNIARSVHSWWQRAGSHPDNVLVFFFCGHGVRGANDYILPSDFGLLSPDNPWADALDIRTTASGLRQVVGGHQFFFVDACRQMVWQPVQPGAVPPALVPVNMNKRRKSRSNLILKSTAEGEFSHGDEGKPSWFTAALIGALSGHVGAELPNGQGWVVTSTRLASAVGELLYATNVARGAGTPDRPAQTSEIGLLVGSQPFQYLTDRPEYIVVDPTPYESAGPEAALANAPGIVRHLPYNLQVQVAEAKEADLAKAQAEEAGPPEPTFSVEDYFGKVLPVLLRWKGEIATHLNKRVRFKVKDAPETWWTLSLTPPEATVMAQDDAKADLTIVITKKQMQKVLDGTFDARKAIANGKIEIYGDLNLLKTVGKLLSGEISDEVLDPEDPAYDPTALEPGLSPEDYFEVVLPQMLKWKNDEVVKLGARVRFTLFDKPDASWTIDMSPPEARVIHGDTEPADLVLQITSKRFEDILAGRFDAADAIAKKEIELFGDKKLLRSVAFLFAQGGSA